MAQSLQTPNDKNLKKYKLCKVNSKTKDDRVPTMHCVIDWVPSTDDVVFALNQQRIEINVNSANGIVSTICVVVQNSVIKPHGSNS